MTDQQLQSQQIVIPQCRHYPECGGCQDRTQSLDQQSENKKQKLIEFIKNGNLQFFNQTSDLNSLIQVHQFGSSEAGANRDRVDYIFTNGELGLYQKFNELNHQFKKVLDIPDCQILSPGLKSAIDIFRQNFIDQQENLKIWQTIFKHPVSLRFRFHPLQTKPMLWLDAANLEIKQLLEEKHLIAQLVDLFDLEIGQKFKKAIAVVKDVINDPTIKNPTIEALDIATWKLTDANLKIIFSSRYQKQEIPLYGLCGHFTQPSLLANQWIVAKIENWASLIQAQNCVEFGCGIGNLSIPVAAHTEQLYACEWNESALAAFAETIKQNQLKNISLIHGDFQRQKNLQKHELEVPTEVDLLLLNPARSGVKDFIKLVNNKTRYVIYMSCFPETMVTDLSVIQETHTIHEMHIIEQFPFSDHFEVLTLLKRK